MSERRRQLRRDRRKRKRAERKKQEDAGRRPRSASGWEAGEGPRFAPGLEAGQLVAVLAGHGVAAKVTRFDDPEDDRIWEVDYSLAGLSGTQRAALRRDLEALRRGGG